MQIAVGRRSDWHAGLAQAVGEALGRVRAEFVAAITLQNLADASGCAAINLPAASRARSGSPNFAKHMAAKKSEPRTPTGRTFSAVSIARS